MEKLEPINWNTITDQVDKDVWDKLTSNFWLPEKVPIANDIPAWSKMREEEKTALAHIFAGLTLLDTIQGTIGAQSMIKDADTPHEEAVLGNISFMECLTGEHELLTPHGWKSITEITVDDTIAQYNMEQHAIEFVKPIQVSSHFAEKTYLFKSRNGNVNQHVSPGHRMFLKTKKQKDKASDANAWYNCIIEAQDIKDNMFNTHTRFINVAPTNTVGDNHLSAEQKLAIAIQADGSWDNTTKNSKGELSRTGVISGTVPVKFASSKIRKINRIQSLADEAGWDIRYYGKSAAHKNVKERLHITLKVPVDYVPKVRNKKLADAFDLSKITRNQCVEFINEIELWDGHKTTETSTTYWTTDKDNADFVTAVAALAGYRAHVGITVDNRKPTYSDVYQVSISKAKDWTIAASVSKTELPGEMVYGVEVSSTFLVTRRDFGITITGNCVHAKSYSSIFSTLMTTLEINEAFEWSATNKYMQYKANRILDYYEAEDPVKKKIASVLLESFLFFSGFYYIFHLAANAKLTNSATVIQLILRDESVHGYYLGYKAQKHQDTFNFTQEMREQYKNDTYDLVLDLMDNEYTYMRDLYDELGLTDEAVAYTKYNANKALMNLGYEPLFSKQEASPPAEIMSFMDPTSNQNHDFFSDSGSSYVLVDTEETEDSDWEF